MSTLNAGNVSVGDVLQVDPEHDERFGGCFLLVHEVKSWGVMGAVRVPQAPAAADAFYRLPYDKAHRIGRAEWLPSDIASDNASPV